MIVMLRLVAVVVDGRLVRTLGKQLDRTTPRTNDPKSKPTVPNHQVHATKSMPPSPNHQSPNHQVRSYHQVQNTNSMPPIPNHQSPNHQVRSYHTKYKRHQVQTTPSPKDTKSKTPQVQNTKSNPITTRQDRKRRLLYKLEFLLATHESAQ